MEKKRVLMAMSGGIDSTVAAMLLLEQGYELVGVTYRTFDNISRDAWRKKRDVAASILCSKRNVWLRNWDSNTIFWISGKNLKIR